MWEVELVFRLLQRLCYGRSQTGQARSRQHQHSSICVYQHSYMYRHLRSTPYNCVDVSFEDMLARNHVVMLRNLKAKTFKLVIG